jgi:hypothetical protein
MALLWANLRPVTVLFGRTVGFSRKPMIVNVFWLFNGGEERAILLFSPC